MGIFFISDYWNWLSKSCWFWGYKKFDPIPWEFGFNNFAQNLKLRGLSPYAWAFYSKSHPKRSTFYAGQFHTWNKRYLFDLTSTHAISTPVKFIFRQFFVHIFYSVRRRSWDWYQKMWNFTAHLLIYVISLSYDVHLLKRPRKSSKLDFRYSVPRNFVRVWYHLNDFEALLSELFRLNFHLLSSKIEKFPEFNLNIACEAPHRTSI